MHWRQSVSIYLTKLPSRNVLIDLLLTQLQHWIIPVIEIDINSRKTLVGLLPKDEQSSSWFIMN